MEISKELAPSELMNNQRKNEAKHPINPKLKVIPAPCQDAGSFVYLSRMKFRNSLLCEILIE